MCYMEFDLHVHSMYSYDSFLSPKHILRTSKRKGLDGIAITDHNTIQGGLITKKINKDDDFIVIVGTEIKTEIGDVIGLFLQSDIRSRMCGEVIEEIRDQGGISVFPHPFRGHKSPEKNIDGFDLIEVFNSRSNKMDNENAATLAESLHKSGVGGSDAHCSFEIGGARTVVEDVNALKGGRTKVIGKESSYYIMHGLSCCIQHIKKVIP